MNVNQLMLAAGAALAVMFVGSTVSAKPVQQSEHAAQGGQAELRNLALQAGLTNEWIIFFEGVARGESKFNNLVGLGDPSLFPPWAKPNTRASLKAQQREAAGAASIYDRAKSLHTCNWPRSRYVFGSGGWFGMMPASGLMAFHGTDYECLDPWAVFDQAASLVMAMGYAKRVMGWSNFKSQPTWLNLRVGWGNPSNMGEESAMDEIASRFGESLAAIGQPKEFMYRPVKAMPKHDPVALLNDLWGVA